MQNSGHKKKGENPTNGTIHRTFEEKSQDGLSQVSRRLIKPDAVLHSHLSPIDKRNSDASIVSARESRGRKKKPWFVCDFQKKRSRRQVSRKPRQPRQQGEWM